MEGFTGTQISTPSPCASTWGGVPILPQTHQGEVMLPYGITLQWVGSDEAGLQLANLGHVTHSSRGVSPLRRYQEPPALWLSVSPPSVPVSPPMTPPHQCLTPGP